MWTFNRLFAHPKLAPTLLDVFLAVCRGVTNELCKSKCALGCLWTRECVFPISQRGKPVGCAEEAKISSREAWLAADWSLRAASPLEAPWCSNSSRTNRKRALNLCLLSHNVVHEVWIKGAAGLSDDKEQRRSQLADEREMDKEKHVTNMLIINIVGQVCHPCLKRCDRSCFPAAVRAKHRHDSDIRVGHNGDNLLQQFRV